MSWRALVRTKGYGLFITLYCLDAIIIWIDFINIFSNISYYWKADPFIIGLSSALYGVPGLILGPCIGRLADKWGPYKILALSYLGRCLTSFLLFMAPSILLFLVFIFFKSISNIGVSPAEQKLIKCMLDEEQIVENASILTIINQFTKLFSPLILVWIAFYHTPNYGFLLSFFMAIFGGIIVLVLKYRLPYDTIDEPLETVKKNIQTIRHLYTTSFKFRYGLTFSLFQSLILGLFDPMLTVILREQGYGAEAFGTIVSSTAIGSLLGAMFFKRFFLKNSIGFIILSMLGFGLSVFIPGFFGMLGYHLAIAIFIILWIINGACYTLTFMNFNVTMQQETPKNQIGVVSATLRSVQLFMIIIGPLVGSAFARFIGVNALFAICGIAALSFSFLFNFKNKYIELK
ncbi:MFS transporter [Xenorhabdus bovienii]|uniref:MFS transporter n=1 Tax=Xenorhabdus bovienii TaxID=40576 RepID=UPI0023B35240|nr:MFS transporter [Xenorhabdus bovienii]MDE9463080.1 MFS transporter [Xenorhabdus bovienii]